MTKPKPSIVDALSRSSFVSTKELRDLGFHSRDIVAAVRREEAFQAWFGMMMGIETFADPDITDAIVCHRTGGVIALSTAAARHHLADALSSDVQIIAPHGLVSVPAGLPAQVRATRTRNPDLLSIGVEEQTVHGLVLRVTNPERTVVDLIRMSAQSPDLRQHALAALTRYLEENDARPLQDMAAHFEARAMIDPLIEVALQMQGGIRP